MLKCGEWTLRVPRWLLLGSLECLMFKVCFFLFLFLFWSLFLFFFFLLDNGGVKSVSLQLDLNWVSRAEANGIFFFKYIYRYNTDNNKNPWFWRMFSFRIPPPTFLSSNLILYVTIWCTLLYFNTSCICVFIISNW